MPILNVISPTEKEKGNGAKLFMITILGAIILVGTVAYFIISGTLEHLFETDKSAFYKFVITGLIALVGLGYLFFETKKKGGWQPVKTGTLFVSGKTVSYNSQSEKIKFDLDEIDSLRLVYSGLNVYVNADHESLIPCSITVTAKGGEIWKWNIVIENRDQKQELKQALESLRKAGIHKMRIENTSESMLKQF